MMKKLNIDVEILRKTKNYEEARLTVQGRPPLIWQRYFDTGEKFIRVDRNHALFYSMGKYKTLKRMFQAFPGLRGIRWRPAEIPLHCYTETVNEKFN